MLLPSKAPWDFERGTCVGITKLHSQLQVTLTPTFPIHSALCQECHWRLRIKFLASWSDDRCDYFDYEPLSNNHMYAMVHIYMDTTRASD